MWPFKRKGPTAAELAPENQRIRWAAMNLSGLQFTYSGDSQGVSIEQMRAWLYELHAFRIASVKANKDPTP